MFLVGEGQHLLQHLDGVRPRGHHVVEHREVLVGGLQRIQLRGGFTRVAVEAHVFARGRLADHQDQGARGVAVGVDQVLQRRQGGILLQQRLHAGQLLAVLLVADQQLPGHRRLHARLDLVQGLVEWTALAYQLLVEGIADGRDDQQHGHRRGAEARQVHRPQAPPEQDRNQAVEHQAEGHPGIEILAEVLAGFRGVRLEHHEDHALRKFLVIDAEIAQADQRGGPQHQPDDRGQRLGPAREQQHRREPDAAQHHGVAEAGEAAVAGGQQEQLGDTGEEPEEQEQPAQAGPVDAVARDAWWGGGHDSLVQ